MMLEYCPCGDLGRLLSKHKRLPEAVARIYISEIILAIEFLHSQGIIYRDLKPDNVVLDADGHCKLTDFGLSKMGAKNDYNNTSFCGSKAYLAPEMIKQKGHGKSIDWYLLGTLIYELVIGVPPYFSKDYSYEQI